MREHATERARTTRIKKARARVCSVSKTSSRPRTGLEEESCSENSPPDLAAVSPPLLTFGRSLSKVESLTTETRRSVIRDRPDNRITRRFLLTPDCSRG